MNKQTSEILGKIAEKIYQINEGGIYTAFLGFSGHCWQVEIKLYKGEWESDKVPEFKKRVYTDWENTDLNKIYDELLKFVERG